MAYPIFPASACSAAAIPTPTVFGAEILDVSATLVQNFTQSVSELVNYNHPSIEVVGVDYCNVTVTYTHPGQNDTLNVETWLPLNTWNGRLQAVGGGGYVAGRFALSYSAMGGALGEGYVTTTTDGGVGLSPDSWALTSEGNANLYALQDFGSVSLNDQAIIAKDLINSFYGQFPDYSYFSGCSQGGRQGLMLAQRYPTAYDGIAASAPAINTPQFFSQAAWAQVLMSLHNLSPPACEFDAFRTAAIAECDPLDGIVDGLVSDAENCHFDAFSMVNRTIYCSDTESNHTISTAMAELVDSIWRGPETKDGRLFWYGPNSQARLDGSLQPNGVLSQLAYAMTSCSKNGTCTRVPSGLGEDWLRLFAQKNSTWDYTEITSVDEYLALAHASVQQYDSIIGTNDPDLSAFRDAGGKIVSYHGMADGLIPTRGTIDYYTQVTKITPNVHDYFRFFEVPGLGHCAGGSGGQPTSTWQALVDWVEKGDAPDSLDISFTSPLDGKDQERILCPYPQKAVLLSRGVDDSTAAAYECTE